MSLSLLTKAPADVLDYDFDFARWLTDGDQINSAAATLTGTTATVHDTEFSNLVARVWLAGGSDGEAGTLNLLITTTEGRTKEVTAQVRIRENA